MKDASGDHMNVLLLSLPGLEENDGSLFPLGIGYLAASLSVRHRVEALHFRSMTSARSQVPERLAAFRPDLVGLTCSTFNRGFVREMIGIVRGWNPAAKIVVGGVHASFCPDQMLDGYDADLVVIGEGEVTIVELCAALEQGLTLSGVAGIAYREQGRVLVNAPRPGVHQLDDLPMPDYSYAREFMESTGMGFLIASRGCPVRCTFCSTSSFWGQRVRMNSVARVVDEMEMLIARFGVKKIFFHDDTFNLGTGRVLEICREIKARGIRVEWACSCRVTPISEEMIAAMVDAGCRHICWGVESGSQEMLSRIDKKISLAQVRQAFELSAQFSSVMSTGAFTMVGNPGETSRTVAETVNFLNTIPITDRPSTSKLYILPGTKLYEDLKQTGQIFDKDWTRYDGVPYYTVEAPYWRLALWARKVSGSGRRIPFAANRHFWNQVLDTSDLKGDNSVRSRGSRVLGLLGNSRKLFSLIGRFMPAGKIRF